MNKLIETTKKGDYGIFLQIQDQYFMEKIKKDLKHFNFDFIDWSTTCLLIQLRISDQEMETIVLMTIANHYNSITFECEECGNYEYIDNKNLYKCSCNKLRCEECYQNGTKAEDDEIYCHDCVEEINDKALGDLI